jgi:hypothetical protein
MAAPMCDVVMAAVRIETPMEGRARLSSNRLLQGDAAVG